MTLALHFFFSAADQQAIDTGQPIQTDDIPYAATPAAGEPYPQAMRLTLQLKDPATPPQVRPLFPGLMRFIVDPTAPGVLPDWSTVTFDDAAYKSWQTRGTLMVTIKDAKISKEIADLQSGLEVIPNAVWFSPIVASRDFLFNSIAAQAGPSMLATEIKTDTGVVAPGDQDWPKYAVAEFLAGRYTPEVRFGSGASQDDAAVCAMPTLVPGSTAVDPIQFIVMTALKRPPDDGPSTALSGLPVSVGLWDPAHPMYGAVPARHVYRALRDNLLDADVVSTVPSAILADWPAAVRYFPLSFARTWKQVDGCSVYFPSQVVTIADDRGSQLAQQRLPAHGVLYLAQTPAQVDPQPDPPKVTVSVAGGMRWLDGGTSAAWKQPASAQPVSFDLSLAAAFVVLRRRMKDAVLAEPISHPASGATFTALCTYLSERRVVRALVDNRITGGSLNNDPTITSDRTTRLINDAWKGHPSSVVVANAAPATNPSSDNEINTDTNGNLLPVLRDAFLGQSQASGQPDGLTAHYLWVSNVAAFQNPSTMGYYKTEYIGRGAAGAIRFMSLSDTYAYDPPDWQIGVEKAVYVDQVVEAFLKAGVEPGAMLQFWQVLEEFITIKMRTAPLLPSGIADLHLGHSMTFLRYATASDAIAGHDPGFFAIDQFGEHQLPIFRYSALQTTLALALQQGQSYQTLRLAALQQPVRRFQQIVIDDHAGNVQFVTVREHASPSQGGGQQTIKVATFTATSTYPTGTSVSRSSFRTFQWPNGASLIDIDVWMAANWNE